MPIEFDIKITDKDMYRFNMYHAYTGFQGGFATVVGIAVILVAFLTRARVDTMYTILYFLFGIIFLVYMPVNLWLRSKRQILLSPALKETLHYSVDGKGIHVSMKAANPAAGGNAVTPVTADLEWKMIYKMVSTKSNLLIYSSRVNAYVMPRQALGSNYGKVTELAQQKLEKYRLKVK